MPSDAPAITAHGPYFRAKPSATVAAPCAPPDCTRAIWVERLTMRRPRGVRHEFVFVMPKRLNPSGRIAGDCL